MKLFSPTIAYHTNRVVVVVVSPLSETRRMKDKAHGIVAQRLVKVLRLETSVISKPVFVSPRSAGPACPVSDEGSKPSGERSYDHYCTYNGGRCDAGTVKGGQRPCRDLPLDGTFQWAPAWEFA